MISLFVDVTPARNVRYIFFLNQKTGNRLVSSPDCDGMSKIVKIMKEKEDGKGKFSE